MKCGDAYEKEWKHIFIDIYGLLDELTSDVADKDAEVWSMAMRNGTAANYMTRCLSN